MLWATEISGLLHSILSCSKRSFIVQDMLNIRIFNIFFPINIYLFIHWVTSSKGTKIYIEKSLPNSTFVLPSRSPLQRQSIFCLSFRYFIYIYTYTHLFIKLVIYFFWTSSPTYIFVITLFLYNELTSLFFYDYKISQGRVVQNLFYQPSINENWDCFQSFTKAILQWVALYFTLFYTCVDISINSCLKGCIHLHLRNTFHFWIGNICTWYIILKEQKCVNS